MIGKAKRIEKMVAANKADETQKREQELAPLPSSVGELSFYKIEGNDEFKRMHVFDNGVQTTMRMPPGIQDLPAIFMVDADNKLMPINYRVADRKSNTDRDVLTIERTAPRWLLKIGKSVDVKITKEQ